MGAGAFEETALQQVQIPRSVILLGEGAFQRCAMLRSATFRRGARLARIEAFCFAESGLLEVSLPSSVCAVGDAAFEKCTSLRHATLNEGLRELGRRAFARSALRSVSLPASLERAANAFCNCAELEYAELAEGTTEV